MRPENLLENVVEGAIEGAIEGVAETLLTPWTGPIGLCVAGTRLAARALSSGRSAAARTPATRIDDVIDNPLIQI